MFSQEICNHLCYAISKGFNLYSMCAITWLKENHRYFYTRLKYTLWIDRVRVKNALGTSLYFLVYGQEPVFPLNLKILLLKFMSGYVEDVDRVQIRLMNILEMNEKWAATLEHMVKHQAIMKRWFDKKVIIKYFRIYDFFSTLG